MHVRGLIELAGILASDGPLLLRRGEPLSANRMEPYWTASRVRFDRWALCLKKFSTQTDSDAKCRRKQWPTARGVMEEILAGEMLTRVWTAVLAAYDRQRGGDDAEPIARERDDRTHGGSASRVEH